MAIRIQLQGGLGNQLFVWAMAHEIVKQTQERVELLYLKDRNSRDDRPIEIFGLLSFCHESISIHQVSWPNRVFGVVDKLATIDRFNQIDFGKLLGIRTMKETFDVPDTFTGTKLLRGYFQNKNLVEPLRESISTEIQDYLKVIRDPENLFGRKRDLVIHIRRGDTTQLVREWGILEYGYYRRNLGDQQDITVVTDDPRYTSEIESYFPRAEILTPNICDSWQALKLMANARHLIMANSTLSWWSGWLMSQNMEQCTFPYPWRPGNIEITEKLIFGNATLSSSEFRDK